MYLDFEHSLHHGYAKAVGVSFDEDKLLLYQPTTMEEGLLMAYIGIQAGVDLIVIDSASAMVPKGELEKKPDDPAKIGALAAAMSNWLPKVAIWLSTTKPELPGTAMVFINQTRASISTGGGRAPAEDGTSGGKALKFYASIRVKLTRIRSDSVDRRDKLTGKSRKYQIGNHVQAKIIKNKISGTQGHSADFFIRYGFGIDEEFTMIESGVAMKLVKKEGAYLTFAGERLASKEKMRQWLKTHPDQAKQLREAIQKSLLDMTPQAIDPEDLDDEEDLENSILSTFGTGDEEDPEVAAVDNVMKDEEESTASDAEELARGLGDRDQELSGY